MAVFGILLTQATYLLYVLGWYWAQAYPSDDQTFDVYKAFFEFPIYLVMCFGLLWKRTWGWWLAVIWLGIPHLPLSLPEKQYAIIGFFFNAKLAALATVPFLLLGQPIRVLALLYLVSHHRQFNK